MSKVIKTKILVSVINGL